MSDHTTKVGYAILHFQYSHQRTGRLSGITYPTLDAAREYVKGYMKTHPPKRPEIWRLSGGKWEKVE